MENRIRQQRNKLGMTQKELSNALEISQTTLSNWERGTHEPNHQALIQFSAMFDCSIDYLLCNCDHEGQATDSSTKEIAQALLRIAKQAKDQDITAEYLERISNFLSRNEPGSLSEYLNRNKKSD